MRADLADSHAHPPRVTAGLRAGHLTGQALLLAFGLLWLTVFSGLFTLILVFLGGQRVGWRERELAATLRDPAARDRLVARVRGELAAGRLTPGSTRR